MVLWFFQTCAERLPSWQEARWDASRVGQKSACTPSGKEQRSKEGREQLEQSGGSSNSGWRKIRSMPRQRCTEAPSSGEWQRNSPPRNKKAPAKARCTGTTPKIRRFARVRAPWYEEKQDTSLISILPRRYKSSATDPAAIRYVLFRSSRFPFFSSFSFFLFFLFLPLSAPDALPQPFQNSANEAYRGYETDARPRKNARQK